jgi:hypothetical protein
VIISHTRKFIFIKTMKTAGTSLELALSEHCADPDVLSPLGAPMDEKLREGRAGISSINYRYSLDEWLKLDRKQKLLAVFIDYHRSKFTEHMAAAKVRAAVGEEIWNSYYKFTIVRHPYDRFVSRYFHDMHYMYTNPNKRNREEMTWGINSPDTFIRYKSDRVNENWRLYSDNDKILVDKVVRYENMKEDLAEVSESIGIGCNLHDQMKEIRTKGQTRPSSQSGVDDVLTTSDKLSIYLLCRREFELFGYDPGRDVREVLAPEMVERRACA